MLYLNFQHQAVSVDYKTNDTSIGLENTILDCEHG